VTLRDANLDRLDGSDLDVLVVGGGINGAVSAAALAARGARVGLVDGRDFAGFTSEQSSNLVWGGIKYLQNYELGLVRHLCTSRNRLVRAYPTNVREIRFLGSLDRRSPYPPWFVWSGAVLYWLIGNLATRPPVLLGRRGISAREPVVDVGRMRGGLEYSDAYLVDNDSRFVFSFVRAALNFGALAVNYVRVTAAERHGARWHVELCDEETGRAFHLRTRVLINATGPFADRVNADHGIRTRHHLVLSKGIHLVVPRISTNERVLAFYDDTDRLFFVIPMGPRSVIGTTDTRVEDPEAAITDDDRRFLLDQVNARLALDHPLTPADIISERCGVRPLVVDPTDDETAHWTALSRKHAIEVDPDRGHLTIFGGKLTDCLNVGREVYDVARSLGVPLSGYRRDWYGEPPGKTRDEFFRQAALMRLDELRRGTYETLTERLWRRYGLRAFTMIEAVRHDPTMADDVIEDAEYVRAELEYGAPTEMVTRLEDFLRRRSKIAMVIGHADLQQSKGLHEACRMLFGADASRRHEEYFGEPVDLLDRRTPRLEGAR
jgi:glycerol-3-phosphate dehydrogenase